MGHGYNKIKILRKAVIVLAAERSAYRGCLLGLAVGDAMGYTVDALSWPEIREDYGPNGLLGYDLVNGYAEITSYTQLAAFTCNGLLLGITRGQMKGRMLPYVRYIALSDREWCVSQRPWGRPEKTYCWRLHQPELCRRHCMDTRMMDTISRGTAGAPEEPVNHFQNCGSITTAAGVGLFFDPDRMAQEETDRLGAEAVALTHGSPLAFLTGALVAHIISRVLRDRKMPLETLYRSACEALEQQFGHQYSHTYEITSTLRTAIRMAGEPDIKPQEAMERLRCTNAAQVLAGAGYATLVCREDFDNAMITAINHSGRAAAVGALAGAILGARLGEEALPDFYLDCLEPVDILRQLADDICQGCPMEKGSRLFDDDWHRKYLRGGK